MTAVVESIKDRGQRRRRRPALEVPGAAADASPFRDRFRNLHHPTRRAAPPTSLARSPSPA